MSMKVLTALQLAGIIVSYLTSAQLMPCLLLRKRLRNLPASARFAAYFTAGNFYIIILVLLLELLRLPGRPALIVGSLAPFIAALLFMDKTRRSEMLGSAVNKLYAIVCRDLPIKTMYVRRREKLRRKRYLRHFYKEILSVIAVAVLIFCVYGRNSFENYGYGHPELIGYNAQINAMSRGGGFPEGAFGFNCIIYYLHAVYGIKTMTLLRLFGIVQTAALCFTLPALMKTVCKSRYIPYLTAAGFAASGVFFPESGSRLAFALPQVFGTVFVPAAALFLISFFKEYRRNKSADRLNLIFFGISVLTAFSALFAGGSSGTVLACAVCTVGGFCVDRALFLPFKKTKYTNTVSLCVCTAGLTFAFICGVTRPLPRPSEEYVQSDAVICAENILRDNKGKDYTWTIVSAGGIGLMTEEYGTYYDAADFLRDISVPGAEVKIKAPTVYVCIEKEPAALMSELYRWAQCFRELYPNEVDVYLETDSFVCYRISQNGSFYDMAIDHGYNEEGGA